MCARRRLWNATLCLLGQLAALGTVDSGCVDSPSPPLTSLAFLLRGSTLKCRGKVGYNFEASSESDRSTFKNCPPNCFGSVGVKCSSARSPRRLARTRPAGLDQVDGEGDAIPEQPNWPSRGHATHRGQGLLFLPVCAETDLWSSSGVTKFGVSAQLSSAQHGDRVDSNPSGLWDQQSGGGSRGVAGRDGVAEEGHAGVAAGKTLGYQWSWDRWTII